MRKSLGMRKTERGLMRVRESERHLRYRVGGEHENE